MCGIFGISQSNSELNKFKDILKDIKIYVEQVKKEGLILLDYPLS